MKTLNIQLPEHLFELWSNYATEAGLPLESLMVEATRYSIMSDRLGVEDAKIQDLQRQTREAELKSRLKKAGVEHSDKSVVKKETTVKNKVKVVEDELPTASISASFDDSINMADLEEAVSREH